MEASSRVITIHASLDFADEMVAAKLRLERFGYTVILPELKSYQHIRDVDGDDTQFTQIKRRLTDVNIRNVEMCSALLILNYAHRGIANYVGGNSFLEMVIAYYLQKTILLLNPIPENMPYTEEMKAIGPQVLLSLDGVRSVHI